MPRAGTGSHLLRVKNPGTEAQEAGIRREEEKEEKGRAIFWGQWLFQRFFSGLSYFLPLELEQECSGPGRVSLLVDQSFDALISLPVTKAQDRLQLMDGLTTRLEGLRGMNRPWYTVHPNMEDPWFS